VTATAAPSGKVVVDKADDPRNPLTRLGQLFDPGTVELLTEEDDSGMLAAICRIDGATTTAFCSDATIQGGAMGEAGCKVILIAYEKALAEGCPVVGLWHSGGARLREGVVSLHAVGEVFAIMTRASGKVPQISVVLGPAAGGAAFGPALTDVVILGPEGRVFVTGPDVVRSVTGEDVDALRLGGPEPHGRRSGVVHVVAESQEAAYGEARRLAALLGDQRELGEIEDRDLAEYLPDSPKRAYDVHPIVEHLLDDGSALELHPKWAPNVTTTLGRLGGRTVGVVANNPLRLGGCLDSASAEKAARFVRMCDAFGVPLVVVVDVPGYLPGVGQEWDGVVRRGAKLLHAFAECTVPRVTLVTRKAYGGAYIAMNSR
jgi:acetyl-CoA/propionyl-CoA carboxylase carboxyl transferase subunit